MNSEEILNKAYSAYYKSKNKPFRYIPSLAYQLLFIAGCILVFLSVPFEPFKNLLFSDIAVALATLFIAFRLRARSNHKRGYMEGYQHASKLLKPTMSDNTISDKKEVDIFVHVPKTTPLQNYTLN